MFHERIFQNGESTPENQEIPKALSILIEYIIIYMLSQTEIKKFLSPINAHQQSSEQPPKCRLNFSHQEQRRFPTLPPPEQCLIIEIDASYNYFKSSKELQKNSRPEAQYINLSFNFFSEIDGNCFTQFRSLKVLDLSANRLESVEVREEHFPCLQALYLKNNKIKFFVHCPNSIEMLSLDHNCLEKLAFTGGKSLQIVSASSNYVSELEFEISEQLVFLDLENNRFRQLNQVQQFLKKCPGLLSLNMIENYVSKIAHKRYLISVLSICQKVVKIDEVVINPHIREAFKLMREEQNLQNMIDDTQNNYQHRMQEQLKLKEEMLDKIRLEADKLQENFQKFLDREKEQLDALENYAKNNVGKRNYGSSEQQNKNMMKDVKKIMDEKEQPDSMEDFTNVNLGKMLVNNIIDQHKHEYQDYKKQKERKEEKPITQMKKFLQKSGLEGVLNLNTEEGEDLPPQEVNRRKSNMRNPNLVYRNSNQLLHGSEVSNTDKSKRMMEDSSEDDQVLDLKCIPYLVKNYGFHTVP